MSNRESTDPRNERARRSSRRSRRNPRSIRRDNHTSNSSAQMDIQTHNATHGSNGYVLHLTSGPGQRVDNNVALNDDDSEQANCNASLHNGPLLAHMPPDQHTTNGYNHGISRNDDPDAVDQAHEVRHHQLTLTHDNLERYLTRQDGVHNYALEYWRTQPLEDGPIRLIPELLELNAWDQSDAIYGRESDMEATKGESPNEQLG
ncbi:uncharacterized protein F4822DRAFT_236372 [Hypoxylon trugodes]|uniref:uncharacterized protein n=1 Tax=Hypoxylon trugodes TaxID=326681 RepID=UPI00218E2605|nr:uncharacterized protein F4822DRAFT_236372 [Hypoxylon trugodes]KAI1388159.1 hypothetical protein F4822DRAFT_236372 [Hypoxylon trugodes]